MRSVGRGNADCRQHRDTHQPTATNESGAETTAATAGTAERGEKGEPGSARAHRVLVLSEGAVSRIQLG
jgi:hypothetical protein